MEVDSEESEYFECEAAITGSFSLNLESDSEKIKTIQITEMGRESKSECLVRKISCLELFSEDLAGILLGLLKDNEKIQGIIENGFKEVETKQQKMFDWIQNENNAHVQQSIL